MLVREAGQELELSRAHARGVVLRGCLSMAAAIGVGRFVFTPILPLMERQVALTPSGSTVIASANYVGYLAGALLAGFFPRLIRSRLSLRISLAVLIAALGLMPVSTSFALWVVLRFSAGVASALVFVATACDAQSQLRRHPHLVCWVFGGVGAGIALTGPAVLLVSQVGTWRDAWWAAAAVCGGLALVIDRVPVAGRSPVTARTHESVGDDPEVGDPGVGGESGRRTASPPARSRGLLRWLTASYFLEGVGYIIAATFLVAAVSTSTVSTSAAPSWPANVTWTIAGLAALPSCTLWALLGRRMSPTVLLALALIVQAVTIALPAFAPGPVAALAAAVGFGGTFMAVTQLALTTGSRLGGARTVATLTAAYSLGQVLGPLLARPVLAHGYRSALTLSGAVLLAAALCAVPLARHRTPGPARP
ncbi:YbfB/YjiJ family MFS transporter [Streptomyces pathocidini]